MVQGQMYHGGTLDLDHVKEYPGTSSYFSSQCTPHPQFSQVLSTSFPATEFSKQNCETRFPMVSENIDCQSPAAAETTTRV